MERALVIFESMFGNTRTITEAVADGLSSRFVTERTDVSVAPTTIPEDVSLVVVGGPTHAFGLTRPRTREDAETQTEVVAAAESFFVTGTKGAAHAR